MSTPAVDGEAVYIGSWEHHKYALNKGDGTLQWKYKSGWSIQSSPLIVDDRIIVGSQSAQIFGIDKNSGKELWMTRFWSS